MAQKVISCDFTDYPWQGLGSPHETTWAASFHIIQKGAQIVSLGTPSPFHGELLKPQLMTFGICTSLLYNEC